MIKYFYINRDWQRSVKQLFLRYFPLCLTALLLLCVNEQLLSRKRHKRFVLDLSYKGTYGDPDIDPNSAGEVLWPNDPECSGFKVQFGLDLEKTFLVSFPRSGNTWSRYLLEAASGIYTGSVYNDEDIYNMGLRGEMEPFTNGRTIVIKTHTHAFKESPVVRLQGEVRVILLMRNPADAITSFWSFKWVRDHEKDQEPFNYTISENTYKGLGFRKFFRENLEKWSQIYESTLVWTKNLLVVFYEDLRRNPVSEVRRMLDFLMVKERGARLRCTKKHMKGPAQRIHKELEIDPFTKSEKKFLAHALTNVVSLLNRRGIKPPKSYSDLILPLGPEINLNNSFS